MSSNADLILVTGATGFLGGHLVARLLAMGSAVRILCRRPPGRTVFDAASVETAIGDITDPSSLDRAFGGVRQVYHVAGRVDFAPDDPGPLRTVNEQGTRNVLEAAFRNGVERAVHVSSVSTIGAVAGPESVLREDDFGKGLGIDIPYPFSKRLGELAALEFAARGFPVVIVNPTFFVGPADWNLTSAHTILSFVQRQLWVGLSCGGMGVTDVRDVAEGARLAMARGRPGERYILGGENLLLREYHALIGRVTGLRPPRFRVPPLIAAPLSRLGRLVYWTIGRKTYVSPADIRMARHYWLYDYSKARAELGLVTRPAEAAVRATVTWLIEEGYYRPRR